MSKGSPPETTKSLFRDCIQGEDGYWVFWPTANNGAYTVRNLKLITEHLSELNKITDEWYDNVSNA